MTFLRSLIFPVALLMAVPLSASSAAPTGISYHQVNVDGHRVFYREAGSRDAPTILLLHGFPSSSRMFERLMPLLADRYHLVAPDYMGFGHSDMPSASAYNYTFDNLAAQIDALTSTLGLNNYAIYMNDFGAPVGYRLALAHPERVKALIVQNAVAHEEGLAPPSWDKIRAFWKDRASHESRIRTGFSLELTRRRHVGSSPHPERYDPDLWTDEYAFLNQPGQHDIQSDLFYDYRTNVAAYPSWQAYLRKHQPPVLVTWGKYDPNFTVAGALAYKRDVPNAEIHLLEGGHFALDEANDEIARLMRDFLERKVAW
ncbi:alpha/beta hydrolase [Dyella sp. GSA-30]|uniref:alpha/beta fold hydrolase n=1 Tax=Dyella sp. GSA-30 TaxID=2994496 RepID=UPI00249185B1|nr:alpha/beta hydrolase [Dyella sp. GSA-30]BDU18771.1 alpha/beta hydrolase [Dyella sp. GSA-30]